MITTILHCQATKAASAPDNCKIVVVFAAVRPRPSAVDPLHSCLSDPLTWHWAAIRSSAASSSGRRHSMAVDAPGDAEEFARARLDSLRRFAYLICGSAAEADDLAQIAVIEIWRRWHTVRGNPEAYARQVIVTRNVSRWRRWRREILTDDADRRPDDPAGSAVTNAALWHALQQLGKPERTVVVLHVLYDYTFREIAALSDEPQGTVSSRYARARLTLREHLMMRSVNSSLRG
jgi:RNA polymerase sigma factor (sigma-70 family)